VKEMSPDMKLIVLANMKVKLFSWTFTFCEYIVRQQIWGKVIVLIQASSIDPFWTWQWTKILNIGPLLPKLQKK